MYFGATLDSGMFRLPVQVDLVSGSLFAGALDDQPSLGHASLITQSVR